MFARTEQLIALAYHSKPRFGLAFWNHLCTLNLSCTMFAIRGNQGKKERERESSQGHLTVHRCDRYTAEMHGIQAERRNETYLVSGMRGTATKDARDFWNDASARGIPGRL